MNSKNERKVVWNLSEFVKTFMITQHEREWPTCLALTSVTEQFSNWSSNQVYFSPVMILFLKLNLDNWRRVSVKISSVFFFFMPEQKVHVKVAES